MRKKISSTGVEIDPTRRSATRNYGYARIKTYGLYTMLKIMDY
jgi:hypothetical protein